MARKSKPKRRNPRYRGLKPFPKGVSGNPKGRPPGSRNKVNRDLELDELVRIMRSRRSTAAQQVKAAELILWFLHGPPR